MLKDVVSAFNAASLRRCASYSFSFYRLKTYWLEIIKDVYEDKNTLGSSVGGIEFQQHMRAWKIPVLRVNREIAGLLAQSDWSKPCLK